MEKFEIMEDDGTGSNAEEAKWTRTPISYTQATGTVKIGHTQAAKTSVSQETRDWSLLFIGLSKPETLRVHVDGFEIDMTGENVSNGFLVKVGKISRDSKVTVELGDNPQLGQNDVSAFIFPFLHHAKLPFGLKEKICGKWITARVPKTIQVSRLSALEMDRNVLDAVLEFVLADSRD